MLLCFLFNTILKGVPMKQVAEMRPMVKSQALKELMLINGLTARALAASAGVGVMTVYGLLRGNSCTVPVADKIAKALEVEATKIFTI